MGEREQKNPKIIISTVKKTLTIICQFGYICMWLYVYVPTVNESHVFRLSNEAYVWMRKMLKLLHSSSRQKYLPIGEVVEWWTQKKYRKNVSFLHKCHSMAEIIVSSSSSLFCDGCAFTCHDAYSHSFSHDKKITTNEEWQHWHIFFFVALYNFFLNIIFSVFISFACVWRGKE